MRVPAGLAWPRIGVFGLRKHQQMAGHSVAHAPDARCVIWVKTRKNSEISRQVLTQPPCPGTQRLNRRGPRTHGPGPPASR